nr:MAG TPA: hypothetical protein [Caudoviricetes sp.]
MARKLKTKKLDKKEVKKEILENGEVHMFLFSVYKASGHLLNRFRLFGQLGLNRYCPEPNSELDMKKVKIKSMGNYPMLADYEGLKSLIEQTVRMTFLFHSPEMKKKYNFDNKIYRDTGMHALYDGLRELFDKHYSEKWKDDLPCEDPEVAEALETLKDIIVNFKVVQMFTDKDLDIDARLRKYSRTLITKFNKHFLPYTAEIIESGS